MPMNKSREETWGGNEHCSCVRVGDCRQPFFDFSSYHYDLFVQYVEDGDEENCCWMVPCFLLSSEIPRASLPSLWMG